MSVGGSIESISVRGRNFSVAADADGTRKLGGFSNALEMNGDASARVIKTRVGWALSGITVDVNDVRGDHEFLQELCDGKRADADGYFPIVVTLASGISYSGKGLILDDLEYNTQNTTASLSLGGPGKLIQQ